MNTPALLIVDMQVGMSWPSSGVRNNVPDAIVNTGLERWLHARRARSAEEVHAMSLANLQGEYATVIVSTDALGAL